MKMLFATLILSSGFTRVSQAKPIENGQAFTGRYKIVESNCITRQEDSYRRSRVPLDEMDVVGTPAGLVIDGRLQAVQSSDLVNAPVDSGVLVNAAYLSEREFKRDSVLHFESYGYPVISFTEQYHLDEAGNLEIVKTHSDRSGHIKDPAVLICHMNRMH